MSPTSDLFYRLANACRRRENALNDCDDASRRLTKADAEADMLADALLPLVAATAKGPTVYDVAGTLLFFDGDESIRPVHRGYVSDLDNANGRDLFAPVLAASAATDDDDED